MICFDFEWQYNEVHFFSRSKTQKVIRRTSVSVNDTILYPGNMSYHSYVAALNNLLKFKLIQIIH